MRDVFPRERPLGPTCDFVPARDVAARRLPSDKDVFGVAEVNHAIIEILRQREPGDAVIWSSDCLASK